ncbi:MAG: hypothetical protein J6B16_01010, partial [Clostridia bacterium]|nr:hypothetical protein [Clostridia bacterium]
NSSTSIKIPYTALQNSKVQLFLPNNMAMYNCLRIDNVSDERKSFTSYLLIAEKGLTTTTFRDSEYNLKELENNKSFHSLKMGKDVMKFSITAHSLDCLNEKER